MKPGTRLTALYFWIQGILGFVWWGLLWLVPQSRASFLPAGHSDAFVLSYVFADIILFVLCSLLTAFAFQLRHRNALFLMCITCGAVAYAFLHCVGIQMYYGEYLGPTALMGASALCTTTLAITSRPTDDELPLIHFRVSRANAKFGPINRTSIQIIVFWTLFLGAIPLFITTVERELKIMPFQLAPRIGWLVFILASFLGLISAAYMAVRGRGTPLPSDTAPVLVTSGPYAIVRNPMAIAGLLQGIGIGLLLGSYLVLIYVLIGALMWNQCVRPVEEENLLLRFGEAYTEYTQRVRCWFPW